MRFGRSAGWDAHMVAAVVVTLLAFSTGCMRPYLVNKADLKQGRQLVYEADADPYIPAIALTDNRDTYLRVRKIRRQYQTQGKVVEVEAKDASRGLRIAGLANLVPAAVIIGFTAFNASRADDGDIDAAALSALGYGFGGLMALTGGILLVIGLTVNTHESDRGSDGFNVRVQGSF